MYEQERDKLAHLTILVTYTVFVVILAGEAALLSWDMGAVVLLVLSMLACWVLHIMGWVSPEVRIWLYYILTMLAFFYYGTHETSMYDMAPVMIFAMHVYSMLKKKSFIHCRIVTYYLIMFYDIIFVCDRVDFSALGVTRLLLHFLLVFLSGYMIILVIRRHNAEQEQAEEKITELEETNHRTEQFLTNVSHELRTPINAVTGITAVMAKNETDEVKKKDISAVQNAGKRLFQQIEDILDYTEIDTGRIKISEENYMIASIVNDIISEENQREKNNDLEIIFDIDASVPSILVGDGRKVKKILRHLLDNSIKFTKKGGVYVRISAMSRSYGVNLCIQVCDTGIGVKEGQLDKIKEKFYQSKNGKMRKAGGLGLGLSIVCGMVTAMEGFVQIKSKENEGTEVFISLPQKAADEDSCMSVANREELCIACYLKPGKYATPEVREYFNSTISHMVHGLELALHRISNKGELEKLISIYRLTHLFIGQEEYSEDEAYYEDLTTYMNVIMVAKSDYTLPRDSKLKLIKKPLCSLAIVNALNAREAEQDVMDFERHILCPGVRVLVVDDEPMNLMVAEGIFKEYKMVVTTVSSGMEAIELCKRETYDLIFLDHMMPEMDGVETLKLLRKLSATPGTALTVIAFTANAVSGAREMFRKEGFDDFLSKPVETVELERLLKKVLPRAMYVYADEADGFGTETQVQGKDTGYMQRLENAGVDTRSGLRYCRGDEAFYLELLTKFAQEEEKKKDDMNRFLAEEDCANYRICVHALKSTSKMIGAEAFSAMAKEAEDAAKQNDLAYITGHHEELRLTYENLVSGIREVLNAGNETAAEVVYAEITKEEFLQKLNELKACLETFETDKAETLIAQMNEANYNRTPVVKLTVELKQDVEYFECGEAAVKLARLIAMVEGGEV